MLKYRYRIQQLMFRQKNRNFNNFAIKNECLKSPLFKCQRCTTILSGGEGDRAIHNKSV